MGLLTRLLEPQATTTNDPASDYWYEPVIRGGTAVTPEKALGIAAFWDCVKVISEDVAKLPLVVYERLEDGKRPAPEHPLYPKLHNKPNQFQTSYQWRRLMERCRLQWGNGLSEIVPGRTGIDLIPLHPSRVRAELRPSGTILYHVKDDQGRERDVPQGRMFHLMGESDDGIWGMSVVTVARISLGLTLGQEDYGSKTFAQGIQKRVMLQHPGHLSEAAAKRLGKSFDASYQGNLNTAVLEEGVTATVIGMSNEDAQFLESRRYQAEEVARWFRMKPHKIGILDHATFSNIEHESIDYVIDTLLPELVNFEQTIWDRLLSERDQATYFAEFRVEGLLRGDSKSRAEALQIWRQNGVVNADEWRGIENMNPIPGGEGKVYLQMANYVPLGTVPQAPTAPPPTTAAKAIALASSDHAHLATELASRVLKKQRDRMTKAALKNADDDEKWRSWLSTFFTEQAAEVAAAMHISEESASEFCNEQRLAILHHGIAVIETMEPEWTARLAALALGAPVTPVAPAPVEPKRKTMTFERDSVGRATRVIEEYE